MKKLVLHIILGIALSVAAYGADKHDKIEKLDSLIHLYNNESFDTLALENKIKVINSILYLYLDIDPSKAVYYAAKSFELNTKIDNQNGIAYALSMTGNAYFYLGEYDKAIENYLKSLEIKTELKDSLAISGLKVNIATIHGINKNYGLCLKYNREALHDLRNLNDIKGQARIYNNIGLVHENLQHLDSALFYYEKSLEFKRTLNDKQNMAITLNNIGLVYKQKGDLQKALSYLQKSIDLRREIKDNYGIASTLTNLSDIYSINEEYEKALKLLDESREIGESLNLKIILKNTYQAYADLFEKTKDYAQAFTYFKLYVAVNDSLFNEEKDRRISELQVKYESLEKENDIKLLRQEAENSKLVLEKQTTQQWFLIIGFLFILVCSLTIFYFLLKTRKSNHKLKDEIHLRETAEEELNTTLENLEQQVEERTQELKEANLELSKHKEDLEGLVKERTRELEEKNRDLDDLNKLFVGRELRIVELKEKLKKLEKNS